MNKNVKEADMKGLTSTIKLSIIDSPLSVLLKQNSEQIKTFSQQKRNEIEWNLIGQQNGVSIEFYDRKQLDKKDDKILLFKNINIPSIKIKDSNSQCQTAQFFSVCKLEGNDNYSQIELKAKNLIFQFDSMGECLIQHLRFKETSFHHHGDLFQLVIALQSNKNILLCVFISSPFLVESRKKPYQERAHKEQNISTLYDPFLPSILEKQYNCGGNQMESDKNKTIGDDLQGLIIYFSAQNIRHKVIHPLYLLFKFPQAISLFYNKNIIRQQNTSSTNLIRSLQNHMFQALLNSESCTEKNKYQEKLLILCLKKQKHQNFSRELVKVSKYIQFLEGPVLTFLEKTPTDLPSQFAQMENIEDLKSAYCQVYSEIAQIKIQIKMRHEQYQKQYHTVIEKKGGIPCNDDIFNFEKNNSQMNVQKKNSFHYVCYDLRVVDQKLKESLTKISLLKIQMPENQEPNNIMEVENECKSIQLSEQIQKKQENPNQFTRKQLSLSVIKNRPVEFQPVNEDNEQIRNQNKLISPHSQFLMKSDNIENIKNTDNIKQVEISQKYASFRNKKQNDKKIKVITRLLQQQIQKNSNNNDDNQNNKTRLPNSNQSKKQFLSKRKLDLIQLDSPHTQEFQYIDNDKINNTKDISNNREEKKKSQQFQTNNYFEKQPGKRFKTQILDTQQQNKSNENQQNNKSLVPLESKNLTQIDNSSIKGFQTQLQGEQQNLIYQNSNTQLNTQDQKGNSQGNTSSTASTINRTGIKNSQKMGTTCKTINKNNYKSSSNSSGSSNLQNQDESSNDQKYKNHQQFSHSNQNVFMINSSSDNQNQFAENGNNNKQNNNNQGLEYSSNDQKQQNQQKNQTILEEIPYNGQKNNETKQKLNHKFKKHYDKYHEGYENDEEFDYDEEDDKDRDLDWKSEEVYLPKNNVSSKSKHLSKAHKRELHEQFNKLHSLQKFRDTDKKSIKKQKNSKNQQAHSKHNQQKKLIKNVRKYLDEVEYLTDDL